MLVLIILKVVSIVKIQALTETYTVSDLCAFRTCDCTAWVSIKLLCHELNWSTEKTEEEAEETPAIKSTLLLTNYVCIAAKTLLVICLSFWPFTLVFHFFHQKFMSIHKATGLHVIDIRRRTFNVLSSWNTVLQNHVHSSKPPLLLTHCFEFNKRDIFLFKVIKKIGGKWWKLHNEV